MPSTDFLAAAVRWRKDTQALSASGSAESLDHMAGLAAECACKVLLHWLGAPLAPSGGLDSKRLWVHLPQVLDELLSLASGRSSVKIIAQLPYPNPFNDWSIDDRYVEDGAIGGTSLNAHRDGLEAVFAALQAAALDGEL
ncbi:MAG: hypothetical protein JNM84_03205 [Planctomycetes bacterium]|nr:hypothetical protein [Planctomycetota bacterium]